MRRRRLLGSGLFHGYRLLYANKPGHGLPRSEMDQ